MKPLQNQSVWFNNLPFLMLPPLFWAGNFVVGKVVSDEATVGWVSKRSLHE